MRSDSRLAIFVAVSVCCAIFAGVGVMAFSFGAEPSVSGGPASMGMNCFVCHSDTEFGVGSVEVLGLPNRYEPGHLYDLSVRISDPSRVGAGFELSVETPDGHVGTLLLSNPLETGFAFGMSDYITHTSQGVQASIASWTGSYAYPFKWRAPLSSAGDVTFYAAACATNNGSGFHGEHVYITSKTISPPEFQDGDANGDGDVDLVDCDSFQLCFSGPSSPYGQGCSTLDFDQDGDVDMADLADFQLAFTGSLPADFVAADANRGGLLYDKWWVVAGVPAPSGDHPLYPDEGNQSGSGTFRCKECHGWDYKGVDGAYGAGGHYSGVPGVFGTTLRPDELFDLLRNDESVVANGHGMSTYGLSDDDIWDVTRFVMKNVVDTDDHIDEADQFIGDPVSGGVLFSDACARCHGSDGRMIDFGSPGNSVFVGTIASGNPWEFLHKIRFGHPGVPMPGFASLRWPDEEAADVGAHSATLPVE